MRFIFILVFLGFSEPSWAGADCALLNRQIDGYQKSTIPLGDRLDLFWTQIGYSGFDLAFQYLETLSGLKEVPIGILDTGKNLNTIPVNRRNPNISDKPGLRPHHGNAVANLLVGPRPIGTSYLGKIEAFINAGDPTVLKESVEEMLKAKVSLVNLSMYTGHDKSTFTPLDQLSRQAILVTGVGNHFPESPQRNFRKLDQAIKVTTFSPLGFPEEYAQDADDLDIAAPTGSFVQTVKEVGKLEVFSGVSAAVPVISGAISDVLSLISVSAPDMKIMLKNTWIPTAFSKSRKPGISRVGLINPLRLVYLGKRLRDYNWDQLAENEKQNLLNNPDTYDFSNEAQEALDEALQILKTSSDCETDRKAYDLLRKSFYLNPTFEARIELQTICKKHGLIFQALFYESLGNLKDVKNVIRYGIRDLNSKIQRSALRALPLLTKVDAKKILLQKIKKDRLATEKGSPELAYDYKIAFLLSWTGFAKNLNENQLHWFILQAQVFPLPQLTDFLYETFRTSPITQLASVTVELIARDSEALIDKILQNPNDTSPILKGIIQKIPLRPSNIHQMTSFLQKKTLAQSPYREILVNRIPDIGTYGMLVVAQVVLPEVISSSDISDLSSEQINRILQTDQPDLLPKAVDVVLQSHELSSQPVFFPLIRLGLESQNPKTRERSLTVAFNTRNPKLVEPILKEPASFTGLYKLFEDLPRQRLEQIIEILPKEVELLHSRMDAILENHGLEYEEKYKFIFQLFEKYSSLEIIQALPKMQEYHFREVCRIISRLHGKLTPFDRVLLLKVLEKLPYKKSNPTEGLILYSNLISPRDQVELVKDIFQLPPGHIFWRGAWEGVSLPAASLLFQWATQQPPTHRILGFMVDACPVDWILNLVEKKPYWKKPIIRFLEHHRAGTRQKLIEEIKHPVRKNLRHSTSRKILNS